MASDTQSFDDLMEEMDRVREDFENAKREIADLKKEIMDLEMAKNDAIGEIAVAKAEVDNYSA